MDAPLLVAGDWGQLWDPTEAATLGNFLELGSSDPAAYGEHAPGQRHSSGGGSTREEEEEGPTAGARGGPRAGGAEAGNRDSRLRCQVSGCCSLLEALPKHNKRVRLCMAHMRASEVTTADGARRRFCQKCIRLQDVHDFEGTKRTCVVALAAHNARRRVAPGTAPSPVAVASARASPTERASSPSTIRHPSDSTAAPTLTMDLGAWMNDVSGADIAAGLDQPQSSSGGTRPRDAGAVTTAPGRTAVAMFSLSPAEGDHGAGNPGSAQYQNAMTAIAAAVADAAAMHGCTVHLKLPIVHSPADVPADPIRHAINELFPAPSSAVLAARPGCVLITVDAIVPAAAMHSLENASDVVGALHRASFAGRAASHATVLLMHSAGPAGQAHASTAKLDAAADASFPPLRVGSYATSLPPQLAGASHRAVVPAADGSVTLQVPTGTVHGSMSLNARADGHTLPLVLTPAPGGMTIVSTRLPQSSALDGSVLFLEVQENAVTPGGHPVTALSRSMPALACTVPAVVTQINSWRASVFGSTAVDDTLDTAIRVLGAAMRRNAPLAIRVSAVKLCIVLGWDAVLGHLLTACIPADHTGPRTCGALLLACMGQLRLSRSTTACRAVLDQLTARLLWTPAAIATATRLLCQASHEEMHAMPLCAVQSAQEAAAAMMDDHGARAVLNAMAALLLRSDFSHVPLDELSSAVSDANSDGTADSESSCYSGKAFSPLTSVASARRIRQEALALSLLAAFVTVQHAGCLLMPMLPDSAIVPHLPTPPWHVMKSMPTSVCCNGVTAVLLFRWLMLMLSWAVAAWAIFPAPSVMSCPSGVAPAVHLALLVQHLLLGPWVCSLRTQQRYGPIVKPWQGGLANAGRTLWIGLLSANRPPPRGPYVFIMALRGGLPLVSRAAAAVVGPHSAGGSVLTLLASLKMHTKNVGWDVADAALAAASMAHTTAMARQQAVALRKAKLL